MNCTVLQRLTVDAVLLTAAQRATAHYAPCDNGSSSITGHKNTIVELLENIKTGDLKPVASINPDKHLQHNLVGLVRLAVRCDPLRVQIGKITKHWNTIETIPPPEE